MLKQVVNSVAGAICQCRILLDETNYIYFCMNVQLSGTTFDTDVHIRDNALKCFFHLILLSEKIRH